MQLRALVYDIDLEQIADEDVTWTFAGTTIGTGKSLGHEFTTAATGILRATALDDASAAGFDEVPLTIEPCTSSPPVLVTNWPAGN